MNDTSPKMKAMIRKRYAQMTPDERVEICAGMFETARAIVLSSLPPGLSRVEQRLSRAIRVLVMSGVASGLRWRKKRSAHRDLTRT